MSVDSDSPAQGRTAQRSGSLSPRSPLLLENGVSDALRMEIEIVDEDIYATDGRSESNSVKSTEGWDESVTTCLPRAERKVSSENVRVGSPIVALILRLIDRPNAWAPKSSWRTTFVITTGDHQRCVRSIDLIRCIFWVGKLWEISQKAVESVIDTALVSFQVHRSALAT